MSTRGFIGFVANGRECITYNHSDSYPDGLGLTMLGWLRFAAEDVDALRGKVSALRVVDQDATPTAEDIEQLRPYTNVGVASRSEADWYCLLRETQGYPGAILSAGVMTDASDFPADSLFAEWGYVVDLDTKTFEVYEGFQEAKHDKGRFAERPQCEPGGKYWPVALIASWPLDALPTDEAFIATVEPPTDEDE